MDRMDKEKNERVNEWERNSRKRKIDIWRDGERLEKLIKTK